MPDVLSLKALNRATLALEPFEPLAAPVRDALAEEGLQALRFSEEDATSFDLTCAKYA